MRAAKVIKIFILDVIGRYFQLMLKEYLKVHLTGIAAFFIPLTQDVSSFPSKFFTLCLLTLIEFKDGTKLIQFLLNTRYSHFYIK